jgi:hypothetical protein
LEVDILNDGFFGVVAGVDGVGCGENGCAGVKATNDTGFGD